MRSVRELVRTYVHVNRKEGPKNPVRFGSALALVAILAIGLWWFAGTGPATYGGDTPIASESDREEATTLQTLALPGGGVYVGYPQALYDPSLRDAYDMGPARDAAMAYYLDHEGMAPPALVTTDDGTPIGYAVRPLT